MIPIVAGAKEQGNQEMNVLSAQESDDDPQMSRAVSTPATEALEQELNFRKLLLSHSRQVEVKMDHRSLHRHTGK